MSTNNSRDFEILPAVLIVYLPCSPLKLPSNYLTGTRQRVVASIFALGDQILANTALGPLLNVKIRQEGRHVRLSGHKAKKNAIRKELQTRRKYLIDTFKSIKWCTRQTCF